jgi:hypothetical protein
MANLVEETSDDLMLHGKDLLHPGNTNILSGDECAAFKKDGDLCSQVSN